MTTLTKKDMIERLAENSRLKRDDVNEIVHMFLDAMVEELARGNRIEFRDFGVFEVRQRAPRSAQNPKTLEPVQVPAKRAVRFKPGKIMKQKVQDVPMNGAPQVEVKPPARRAAM